MADQPSEPMSLNSTDWKKVGKDALLFALVPLMFYITAVLGVIQLPNHVVSVKDFVPTPTTVTVIIAWILNQILNLIKKYVA